jgi:hypothetical protein
MRSYRDIDGRKIFDADREGGAIARLNSDHQRICLGFSIQPPVQRANSRNA